MISRLILLVLSMAFIFGNAMASEIDETIKMSNTLFSDGNYKGAIKLLESKAASRSLSGLRFWSNILPVS